jgi:hypothetical protein
MTKTPKSWSIRVAARRPSAQHLSLDGSKETPHHMLLVNSGELVRHHDDSPDFVAAERERQRTVAATVGPARSVPRQNSPPTSSGGNPAIPIDSDSLAVNIR